MSEGDEWASVADRYADSMSVSVRGRVRVHVLHQQLLAHLPPPPVPVIDIGGGAGHQSLPLARLGYEVTIVDPSPAMLAKAAQAVDREDPVVRRRVRLVGSSGEQAPRALAGRRFAAVLCHGRRGARRRARSQPARPVPAAQPPGPRGRPQGRTLTVRYGG